MSKTIFITGSTDGIGLAAAKILLQQGHCVLLHGRNHEKLSQVMAELSSLGSVAGYVADLTDMSAVRELAEQISEQHQSLDALINNAGILKVANATTKDGFDVRFAVNTIAPYLLTKLLLPLLASGRVINVSSAAQAPVDLDALSGKTSRLAMMAAYSQSKLALNMWSVALARILGSAGPIVVAVNPGSKLASKMVKEGFNVAGRSIHIGAEILVRASLADEFADANGKYYDNDSSQFTSPHPDTLDEAKRNAVVNAIEMLTAKALTHR